MVLAGGAGTLLLVALISLLAAGDDAHELSRVAQQPSWSANGEASSGPRVSGAPAESSAPETSGASEKTGIGGGSVPPEDDASPPAEAPTPAPIAPDATFRNKCSYVVGDSTERTKTGYRFLAQSKVENTGNTGIEVEVHASWFQGQADAVTETKRVRVDRGKSTTVNISVPVSRQEIDQIRLQEGPGRNCRVESSIVLTY